MEMNTIIQERRRALGLTQTQVAEHLGVSVPAVSKWETGQSFPDVTLLPRLARLLKIDLNTLFDFRSNVSPEKIRNICAAVTQTSQSQGIDAAFVLAEQYLREFPHSEPLLQCVTLCADGLLNTSALPRETFVPYEEKVTAAYQRLSESEDSQIANSADFMLASRYLRFGELDRAQAVLDRMPDRQELLLGMADKLLLQVNLYQQQRNYDQAACALETALYSAVNRVQLLLARMTDLALAMQDAPTAKHIAATEAEFVRLFALWDFSAYTSQLQVAAAEKDIPGTLALLRVMHDTLKNPWSPQDTVLFRRIRWKRSEAPSQLLSVLCDELDQDPEFAFLRETPEFTELLTQFRS